MDVNNHLGTDDEDYAAAVEIMNEQGISTSSVTQEGEIKTEGQETEKTEETTDKPELTNVKEEEKAPEAQEQEPEPELHTLNPFNKPAPQEQKTEENPAEKAPEADTQQLQQLQAKLEAYDKLFENEQIAWAIAQVNEGKSLVDAIRDVMPVDINSLTPAQLYNMELAELGKSFNLSEEALEKKREEFQEKDEVEQAIAVRSIKAELERKNEEKKGLFKVDTSKVKPTPEDNEAKIKAANDVFIDKVTETVTGMEGQSFFGIKITQKEQKQVFDYLQKNPIETFSINEHGIAIPNGEVVAELAYWRTIVPVLVEVLSKSVDNETRLKLIKERQNVKNPDDVRTGANAGTAKSKHLTAEDAAEIEGKQTNNLNYTR